MLKYWHQSHLCLRHHLFLHVAGLSDEHKRLLLILPTKPNNVIYLSRIRNECNHKITIQTKAIVALIPQLQFCYSIITLVEVESVMLQTFFTIRLRHAQINFCVLRKFMLLYYSFIISLFLLLASVRQSAFSGQSCHNSSISWFLFEKQLLDHHIGLQKHSAFSLFSHPAILNNSTTFCALSS